jgi:hypothetical protein
MRISAYDFFAGSEPNFGTTLQKFYVNLLVGGADIFLD